MRCIRGVDQVGQFERLTGGSPPLDAIEHSRASIQRYIEQCRFRRSTLEASYREIVQIERERLALSSPVSEAHQSGLADRLRALARQRVALPLGNPKSSKVEPQITLDFTVKAPAYDTAWAAPPADTGLASADAGEGTYSLSIASIGAGGLEASAGIGVWFWSAEENPVQRLAALVDYSNDWWEMASQAGIAKNSLRTLLWVWGSTENDWVLQSSVFQPFWSATLTASPGGAYAETGNDPNGDSGRVSNATVFATQANSWYLGWVWSTGYVAATDDTSSSLKLSVSVPMIVFGAL